MTVSHLFLPIPFFSDLTSRLAGLCHICLICLITILTASLPAQAGTGTSGDPFTSLSEAASAPASGRYYFNTGSGLFQADVDMSEGGGWVLILQYVHQGGTNPDLTILGAGSDLPVTSSAALGTDESSVSANWGHAGNAALSQFSENLEFRWYGQTSGHSRIIHFSSPAGADYARTGTGSFQGIESSHTLLSGHSANLPATANRWWTDQGDIALTNFPFYVSAAYHWAVKGYTRRWEVDDYLTTTPPATYAEDTIHRIWVRSRSPLIVTSTADSGTGSLRTAIEYANANPSEDTISFDLTGTGPHTITLQTALPALTDAGISIDGTTQSSSSCQDLWSGSGHTLQIQIVGGTGYDGLQIDADNVTIKGLSLTGFTHIIDTSASVSGLSLKCNYLGLTPAGTASGATSWAVRLRNQTSPEIGGSSGADGNLISASASHGLVFENGGSDIGIQNNFIGSDPTGLAARANGLDGLLFTGSAAFTVSHISDNLISGNIRDGIVTHGGAALSGSGGDMIVQANHIGVDRTGNTALSNAGKGWHAYSDSSLTGAKIGGTQSGEGNIVSGNGDSGFYIFGDYSDIDFLGNIIGLGADGTTSLANNSYGLRLEGVSAINIGDGTEGGRNLISTNLADAILLNSTTDLSIRGNYLGTDQTGLLDRGNGQSGLEFRAAIATIGHTNTLIDGNVISGNGHYGIDISATNGHSLGASSSFTITNNHIGIGADGSTALGNDRAGIKNTSVPGGMLIGGDGQGNIIAHNGYDGIIFSFLPGTNAAILSNRIFGNADLAIDLRSGSNDDFGDGVTANDTGDADTGPNELLNFPVLNDIGSDGSPTISYDLNLDVPAATYGYRIEFFLNSAADVSGHGEGETYLGSVDVSHSGGDTRFTGTLSASQAVSAGHLISATATRKTGPASYDITSEFAANITAGEAQLSVTRQVALYQPGASALYLLPGNDVIVTLDVSNTGTLEADTDSLQIIERIPDELSFFHATTPEFDNQIIGWNETNSMLDFDYARDVSFSDSLTPPSNPGQCTYAPGPGYDEAVKFICLNPKGAMAYGDPDPEFTFQYRAIIK